MGAKSPDASNVARQDSKVLRLWLGETSREKGIPGLASAQDDGVIESATPPPRTNREAKLQYWREIRAGERPDPRGKERPARGSVNPLLDLPDETRAQLLTWLRECPFEDAVKEFLKDKGLTGITRAQLDDFFQVESEQHWDHRITRAAQEANALVRLVEKSTPRFSAGILAALGQEAFRQIASGNVQPDAMGKLAGLFLKARSDERADQMQELKREKLRHDLQSQLEHALEELAREVDCHPAAREAFEALKRELAEHAEENS